MPRCALHGTSTHLLVYWAVPAPGAEVIDDEAHMWCCLLSLVRLDGLKVGWLG
jgi:hypothetical protein